MTVLHFDWHPCDKIKENDICRIEDIDLDYMCCQIIPYQEFEYLYFSRLDFQEQCFVVQVEQNNQNYCRILSELPEQHFAFQLFKKKYGEESK